MYYKSKEAINELFNKFKPKSFDELKQIYNSQSEKKCIDINELFEYIQTTKIGSLARGFYKRSKEERAQLSERYRQELSTILKHGGFDFDLNGLDKFHNGYGFFC